MDRDQAIKLMQDLLRRVTEKKASDLFVTAGFPPAIKLDGEIRPQSERALTMEQSATLVRAIMNDRQTKEFDSTRECNFAIAPPGIGRFRVSAFIQMGLTGAVLRTINVKVPTVDGPVMLSVPKGSTSGKQLRIKGRGFTGKDGHRGDLLIQLAIDLPAQDEALHQFAENWEGGGNPRASLGV